MNNSDITKLKHIEVPTIVLLDEELSSTTKLLMGLINTLSMQEGFCYASNKYLSNLLKVSKRTITSCITSLRTKKYIRVENEPNIRIKITFNKNSCSFNKKIFIYFIKISVNIKTSINFPFIIFKSG